VIGVGVGVCITLERMQSFTDGEKKCKCRSIMGAIPAQSETRVTVELTSLHSLLGPCHAMTSTSKNVYLVIGGSGFLGRHIVNALLARGDSVSVFDIVQRHHDVPFYTGDITEQDSISDALRKVCAGPLAFPS